jgi:hypothetical protein
VHLLVAPQGPIGGITGILPDGWCRMAYPFALHVRGLLQERQLIEAKPPPADEG